METATRTYTEKGKPAKKIRAGIISIIPVAYFILIISCSTKEPWHNIPTITVQGADYVGEETCSLCHEKVVQDFARTKHGRIQIPGGDERAGNPVCEACHGSGSLHMEAGGGRGTYILNPVNKPEMCFQCHAAVKARLSLQYHHPVEKGMLSCTDCHNLHGNDIYSPRGMYVTRENDVCMQCHRDQARPRVFEHEALRDGCLVCHHPHGSINEKMLTERDNNLCLKCHGQLATPGTITIGDVSHTTRLMQGTCWSAGCHTAVHGSNINPHLRY